MTTLFQKLLAMVRYVMPLFYLTIGLALTFTEFLAEETGKFRVPLGILLMCYAAFRTWRLILDHKNRETNETSAD